VESVADLKARLRKQTGSDLLILVGKPEEVIPNLIQGSAAPLVLSSHEVTSEELKVDAAVSKRRLYHYLSVGMRVRGGGRYVFGSM
jgi:deoxyribodipyrimidine photo-lyase